jgi:predicted small lipoprotein YifL
MRKMFALAMVALLALTLALTLVSCGQKTEESSSTTPSETPPAESSMPMDSTMHSDSAMSDTTHH